MENSIRLCSKNVSEANLEITSDRSEHDKMQQRCQALGKALERERKNFHKQTEELSRAYKVVGIGDRYRARACLRAISEGE